MSPTAHDPKHANALTVLTELGREGARKPSRAELDHGLNLLYARLVARRVRQREVIRWSLAGALAAITLLVVLSVPSPFRKVLPVTVPALAYQIEGGRVLDGGYLRESGRAGMKLLFNEGSTFEFTPGSRGWLRTVNREGVRLAVDTGTASFQVTPSSDRRWLIEAGPFLVTVKGTTFVVSWEPSSGRFELNLRQGNVSVSGPVSGGGLELRAGQRLVVTLSRGETLITEEPPQQAVNETAIAPSASAQAPGGSQSSIAEAKSSALPPVVVHAPSTVASVEAERERRWAQDLASGHWDRILKDVERTGTDVALNGASSEDLFALADAARYRRRSDLARASLLAVRRRFPNSPRAVDALFLLGRVEESRGGGMAQAITWYSEYLARSPTGAYAAEALGRKMIATKEAIGATQARPIAEEYLRRFPKGTYAGTARAWLRVP